MENLTKKAIQNRYLDLLGENAPSEVTVTSLVESCGMNRNTFYYHFKDLDDLLASSLADWLGERAAAGLPALMSSLAERGAALSRLFESEKRGTLVSCVENAVARAAADALDARAPGASRSPDGREFVAMCRAMFCGLALDWLGGERAYDLGELASRAWSRLTAAEEAARR